MSTRKSVWAEIGLWTVLLCWLIIPVVIAIIKAKNYRVEIDDTTVRISSGVFNKGSNDFAVAGITRMNVNQSLWGRICNYGDVHLSLAGGTHVTLEGVVAPNEVKNALNKQLQKTANATHVLTN